MGYVELLRCTVGGIKGSAFMICVDRDYLETLLSPRDDQDDRFLKSSLCLFVTLSSSIEMTMEQLPR